MQFSADILSQCWFLAGPTASGKSAVGLELAELLGAEILALDSMTLYRGMDIGTAKPSAAEQQRVPHHLLDILDPDEEFSLADYAIAAEAACRAILSRGRIPLFVGGTGLYLRGVLRGIFEGPAANWELRQKLQDLATAEDAEVLHARLAEIDPASAARLHPRDTRRVIRAIEVYELTGMPLSAQQEQRPLPVDQRTRHVYWLSPDRDWLYARIDQRVEQMFAQGLVAEVERLLTADKPLSRTARQALGYRETIDYLAGNQSLDETKSLIQQHTRQFAKRQHTWFRNLEECIAVPITGDASPASIAHQIQNLKSKI